MSLYWRDLALGFIAWLCGRWAKVLFPVFPSFRTERLADWFSLILYKPLQLLMVTLLFVVASLLLYRLITFHAGALLSQGKSITPLLWLHVLYLGLFGFILLLQIVRFPMATTMFMGSLVLIRLYQHVTRKGIRERVEKMVPRK